MDLYLINEVFWYYLIVMVEVVVAVKVRIVIYIAYTLDEIGSANWGYIKFQYFVIYFN